jgi:hypothetical protein
MHTHTHTHSTHQIDMYTFTHTHTHTHTPTPHTPLNTALLSENISQLTYLALCLWEQTSCHIL